eukprot:scaffold98778_cov63-Phaeocystis_antarctica.AAC.1
MPVRPRRRPQPPEPPPRVRCCGRTQVPPLRPLNNTCGWRGSSRVCARDLPLRKAWRRECSPGVSADGDSV